MDFGKNRVQYENEFWQYYRYDRFDTYFYVGGKELALYTGNFAERKLVEIESFFDYQITNRIIFIVYNKLSDFRQSNIGYTSASNQYNIGGVTKIIDNKVFLYFEGDYKKFEKQISAAIAEVVLNQLLNGSDFKNKFANSTLLSLPDWFTKGLISYVSEDWSVEIDDKVKDGILSKKYEKFNHLSGEDAVYAGHSIWNFIVNTYGKSVIPNILYLTKINKNVENGFLYVLGTTLKYLSYDWLDYYDRQYYELSKSQMNPENNVLKKVRRNKVYSHFKISPDEKNIAFVENELGKYKIFIENLETKKKKKIIRKEHKLDQITDYSYPVMAWHPRGEILSIFIESKGEIKMLNYLFSEDKIEYKFMPYFEKILDFSYSHDGLKIVISGVQNGKSDIFVYNVAANTTEQITNDYFNDFNPRFIENSNKIIFSSDRNRDSLNKINAFVGFSNNLDLFIYDYRKKSKSIFKLTDTKFANEKLPVEIEKNKYLTISDENGIYNYHLIKFDSTISFIDTSTHYRYFSKDNQISNFSRNIQYFDRKSNNISKFFYKGKSVLYNSDNETSSDIKKTHYIQKRNSYLQSLDTTKKVKPIINNDNTEISIAKNDSIIDINNYKFDTVKVNTVKKDTTVESDSDSTIAGLKVPPQKVYFTSFYTNYFVNQIDFGFLSSSYQAFTGGAVYFNPGFNLFLKIGTHDLFEDYRITGGFRFAGNFNSNEYLLSFENLKKRVDKQILIHRQAFTNVMTYSVNKTHTHELMYILKYPFSQVSSVKASLITRYDRLAYLSTDIQSLNQENEYKYWAGLKLEYIFDNTRGLGVNLYEGSRFKLFGEYYKQVNKKKSELLVFGGDYRHYLKIHRTLILASRIAASSSFGSSRLIYYLGGVDNWINLSSKKPTFDRSIPIGEKHNYAYQAVATNMRGFSQNIRNGNSFALINNELRFPIVRYFANRPLNSDFLTNLQLIGFSDIGAAWTGWSPYSEENAYNTEIINNGPITVIIDKDKAPIVYGYGFGIRSRLLGYFIRCDWAWGIEGDVILPRMFYLSLSLDF